MRIDLKKFLIQTEKIGGIEISDSKISIAYLGSSQNEKEIIIERWGEVDLQAGIIERGEVKNKEALVLAINNLSKNLFASKKKRFRKSQPSLKNLPVILSIPSQNIYIQLFSFPGKTPYEQLEESMELTVGFSLPLSAEKIHLDWEALEPLQKDEEKEILLAQVKKSVIDPYLEVFSQTVFLPIVCECYSMSLNRVISRFENNPFCLILTTELGAEITISKFGGIRFVRSTYWKDHRYFREKNKLDIDIKKRILKDEVWRTINYDQTENKNYPIEKIYLTGDSAETPEFKNCLKEDFDKEIIIPEIPYTSLNSQKKIVGENSDGLKENIQLGEKREGILRGESVLIVLGAALRGFIPRSKDVFVSLLPVGTEEEYSNARLMSFLRFVNISAIISALIFIPLFLISYFFMSAVKQNAEKELARLQQIPTSEEFNQMTEESAKFNTNLSLMETLAIDKSDWPKVLEEIRDKKTSGIIYNRINVESYKGGIISLEGMATTRDQLLVFKQNLIDSQILTGVNLSLKYLEKKDNINFIITFRIK